MADFPSGGTEVTPATDVPDLTGLKCTPNSTTGFQQQVKSEVTATSGRVYGNIVAQFDGVADADGFMSAFAASAQACADASVKPIADNFGNASFYFTISASPNDLRVESVRWGNLISIVIQYVPPGVQPDDTSLRNVTSNSLNNLKAISG